jgi:hypothetical protein
MILPFMPGDTRSISASTSSAATGSALVPAKGGPTQVRIHNAAAGLAFVKFGTSGVSAAATDLPVPAGAVEVVSVPASDVATFGAAVLSSGTGTVYLTVGAGI